MNSDAVMM